MQRFEVMTFFDCTETGVVNHKKPSDMMPEDWHFRRNQQRNWETLLQCISLRCQPLNIQGPYVFTNNEGQLYWVFSFETDKPDIFNLKGDRTGILKQDCDRVPMIVGLTESERELFFTPYMITTGSSRNTYFEQV